MTSEALYMPYKVVGLVADDTAFVVNSLGEETFLTVSVGKMFQVFRADRLVPVLVSKAAPGPISFIQVRNKDTYVAVDKTIYRFQRTRLIAAVGEHSARITQLDIIGDFLLSCDESNVLKVFDSKCHSMISEISPLRESRITRIFHPATLLNKLLIGFADNTVELWNIKTRKLLFTFEKHIRHLNPESTVTGCTAMCQSPAVDVVAFGFATGDLLLINIKLDTVVFKFRQKGAVTSISFRTDAKASEYPFIVTGSDRGHLYTWTVQPNANDGEDDESAPIRITSRLQHALYGAHDGAVIKVEFLHGQPVMVSSGKDNSLKMWIFDNSDGSPRLLRSRQGHVSFPKQLRYHGDLSVGGNLGTYVGTASSGIVTVDNNGGLLFSMVDKHCHFDKFSCAAVTKHGVKSPSAVVAMDFTFFGARSWGGLVTVHKDSSVAHVWKVEDKAVTTTQLVPPEEIRKECASAVVVSSCGNFAVIGYASGHVALFNIQSGLFRGFYVSDMDNKKAAARGLISGLFLDIANSILVTTAADGSILFFDFRTKSLLSALKLHTPLIKMVGCKESNLCAVCDSESTIRVVDIATQKVVRVFLNCHSAPITDVSFNLDGRRILSCSLDATVRVFDLASGKCLSWMEFDAPVSSISLTPQGDLLVGKVQHRGIDVCLDRSLTSLVSFNREPSKPVPVLSALVEEMVDGGDDSAEEISWHITTAPVGIKFSAQPKSYWTSLCNMEILRRRNNVAQPVIKVSTPFFLPNLIDSGKKSATSSSAKPISQDPVDQDAEVANNVGTDVAVKSSLRKLRKASSSSLAITRCQLAKMLDQESTAQSPSRVYQYLCALPPAKVDQEFRLLCVHEEDADGLRYIQKLLVVLVDERNLVLNFDVVQSYIHRLLNLHASKLPKSWSLHETVVDVRQATAVSVNDLQLLVHTILSLLKTSLQIQLI